MSSRKKVPDTFFRGLAALGLGLVLVVVLAAAAIRLGSAAGFFLQNESLLRIVRVIHRVAASLEVLVVLWLAWMGWRRAAVLLALALTGLLSIVGILAGQAPPPAAAATNLLGGLALAAVFAWMLAPGRGALGRPALALAGLLGLQLALGGWLSIVDRTGAALPAHGLLAIALAALLGWVGLARVPGATGKLLFALALTAPAAGFTVLHYEYSVAAALVHALVAAALVAAAAFAFGRNA